MTLGWGRIHVRCSWITHHQRRRRPALRRRSTFAAVVDFCEWRSTLGGGGRPWAAEVDLCGGGRLLGAEVNFCGGGLILAGPCALQPSLWGRPSSHHVSAADGRGCAVPTTRTPALRWHTGTGFHVFTFSRVEDWVNVPPGFPLFFTFSRFHA